MCVCIQFPLYDSECNVGVKVNGTKSNLELNVHKNSGTIPVLNDNANGGRVAIVVVCGEQHWRHRRCAFTDIHKCTYM